MIVRVGNAQQIVLRVIGIVRDILRSVRNGQQAVGVVISVAGDVVVGFLEDGPRGRRQIKDKRKCAGLGIRPSGRAAAKMVGVDGIRARDSATGGRQRSQSTVVVFINHDRSEVAGSIRREAPRGRGRSRRAPAPDEESKRTVERSDVE